MDLRSLIHALNVYRWTFVPWYMHSTFIDGPSFLDIMHSTHSFVPWYMHSTHRWTFVPWYMHSTFIDGPSFLDTCTQLLDGPSFLDRWTFVPWYMHSTHRWTFVPWYMHSTHRWTFVPWYMHSTHNLSINWNFGWKPETSYLDKKITSFQKLYDLITNFTWYKAPWS